MSEILKGVFAASISVLKADLSLDIKETLNHAKENLDNNIFEELLSQLISQELMKMEIENLNLNFSDKTLKNKIINNKNTHNDMYLISDNIPVSPKNLYNNISKNLNKKLYTFTINKYLLKIFLWPIGKSYLIDKISSSLIIDNTKIKKALKWTPSVSFDQEVKNMVKGYIKKSGK